MSRTLSTFAVILAAALAAGCANSDPLATASVGADKVAATKADPVCVTLATQIDGLRRDTAVENLEKAATGKSASVQVKRTSIAKQAELNRANLEFQNRCAPPVPRQQTSQIAPAPITPAQVAPATSAQKTVANATPAATQPKN